MAANDEISKPKGFVHLGARARVNGEFDMAFEPPRTTPECIAEKGRLAEQSSVWSSPPPTYESNGAGFGHVLEVPSDPSVG